MSVHGPRCRFTNARSVTRSLRAEVTVAGGSGTVHSHGKIMETPAFWWHLLRTKMEILCDALLVYRKVFENEFMLCTIPWNYTLAIHMHAKNAISKAIVCQHAVRRGLSQYSFAAVGLVYLSSEEIKHVHGAQNAFAHFWNHLKGLCNHTWSTFCLVFLHTRLCSLLQVTRYKIIQKGVLFHNCPTLQATTPVDVHRSSGAIGLSPRPLLGMSSDSASSGLASSGFRGNFLSTSQHHGEVHGKSGWVILAGLEPW